ncbi:MAG: thiamine phosphate synthase [Deltaproteobacteria bacterium]|nr:thiamine phosphate synthase [Deltaproteobacteria bacterium]
MGNESPPGRPPRALLFPLYGIVDPSQGKGRPADSLIRGLLDGGASVIQIRGKTMTSGLIFELACQARVLTRQAGALLIVNDRVDIALATGADGVHLGQDDFPLDVARRLLGDKLIGISTHDLEQARAAEQGGADYIGFGPLFGTATKQTGYSPRGLEMLRKIRKTVSIPIVAIGGITEKNVQEVWEAGADGAAIINDIMGAEDVAGKVRRIFRLAAHKAK